MKQYNFRYMNDNQIYEQTLYDEPRYERITKDMLACMQCNFTIINR